MERQVGVEWLGMRNVGVFIREKVWLENSLSQNFSRTNTPTFLKPSHSTPTCLWRWNRRCSETSAHKIQTPGNYPEESIKRITYSLSSKATKLVHSSSVKAAGKYRTIPFAAVLVRKCNALVLGSLPRQGRHPVCTSNDVGVGRRRYSRPYAVLDNKLITRVRKKNIHISLALKRNATRTTTIYMLSSRKKKKLWF